MWSLIIGIFLTSLSGCNRSPDLTVEKPDDSLQIIATELSENNPEVLWEALPPSYQTDIKEVLNTFCSKVDADLYDRIFKLLDKTASVLKAKEDYIFNTPMALGTPLIESNIGNHWDEVISLMNVIVKSDIKTIESLQSMDPGRFLATTGSKVMYSLQDLNASRRNADDDNPWTMLEQLSFQFLESTNNQAAVNIQFGSKTLNAVEFNKIEGRWIPAKMADGWEEGISQIKTGLSKLTTPEFEQVKPLLNMAIMALDQTADDLLAAKSQKEFDNALVNINTVGQILESFGNGGEKKE